MLTLEASQAQTNTALDRRADRAERRVDRRLDRANYFNAQTWNEMSGWVDQNNADARWMLHRASQAVNNANTALRRSDNLNAELNSRVGAANLNAGTNANANWFGYGEKTPEKDRWFYDYYAIVPSYSPSTVSLAMAEDVDAVEKEMAMDRITVEGKIAMLKKAEVGGQSHLIAQLEKPSENVQVVDLGLAQQLQDKVNVGTMIRATGWVDYIGDEELLIARKVDVNGDWMTIKRDFTSSIEGKVVNVKEIQVNNQPHYVAVVENLKSQRVLVDMGVTTYYSGAIELNATVVVQGIPVQTNERVMVIARDVKLGGKTISIRK